jgi:hypothetical protein
MNQIYLYRSGPASISFLGIYSRRRSRIQSSNVRQSSMAEPRFDIHVCKGDVCKGDVCGACSQNIDVCEDTSITDLCGSLPCCPKSSIHLDVVIESIFASL